MERQAMLIVHVHVHVLPECVDAFREASVENARQSLAEPGIARFDVVQQQDDPTRFALVEAYLKAHGTAPHAPAVTDSPAARRRRRPPRPPEAQP